MSLGIQPPDRAARQGRDHRRDALRRQHDHDLTLGRLPGDRPGESPACAERPRWRRAPRRCASAAAAAPVGDPGHHRRACSRCGASRSAPAASSRRVIPTPGGTEVVLGDQGGPGAVRQRQPARPGGADRRLAVPGGRRAGAPRALPRVRLRRLVIVPVRTGMRMFNRSSLFRILVEVRPARRARRGQAGHRRTLLGERHRAEDVTVITQDAVVSTFSSILSALTLALVAIASVSLTVAGVGIMNVMLVAVTERRRGDRPAQGAGRRHAADPGGVPGRGGGARHRSAACWGWAAGGPRCARFVRVYPTFPAAPPVWAVRGARSWWRWASGSCSALWPARRATRLDPFRPWQDGRRHGLQVANCNSPKVVGWISSR